MNSEYSVIESTARNIDDNSNVPIHPDSKLLDEKMKDGGWSYGAGAAYEAETVAASAANQEGLINIPLGELRKYAIYGGISALALAVLDEKRRRRAWDFTANIGRAGRLGINTARVQPGKAAVAMAWHTYGNGLKMPVYDPDSKVPSVDNVPTWALKDIAKGKLSEESQLTRVERRGIRAMARMLIAERNRDERKSQRQRDEARKPSKKSKSA